MQQVREFCGYLLGGALCIAALALCGLAWLGLEAELGWQWALAAVVVGAVARINVALPVGLYLYAGIFWGWPMAQALAFSAPGLLLVLPALGFGLLGLVVGRATARH